MNIESVKINSPDVLLVLPPLYQSGRPSDYNPKEPMGLMYLSSNLKKNGFRTEIFDADIESKTIDQATSHILDLNPRVVGFSVSQRALPSFELIVNGLRVAGFKNYITCGGITPTLSYPYIIDRMGEKVDSIVLGEGEKAIVEITDRVLSNSAATDIAGLVTRINNRFIVNKGARVVDINDIPFPSRDYLELCSSKTGDATIMGSRDCYGICTFCANNSFASNREGAKWRGRSPVDVVDEMESIFNNYHISKFKFNDPNIFGPGVTGRQHVVDICNLLIKRGLKFHLMGFCRGNDITSDPSVIRLMKKAGFERLLIGVESSNNQILRKFRKGETIEDLDKSLDIIESCGMSTVVGFMIFNPYTTIDSLKQDLSFLKKRGLTPTLSKALRIFDNTLIQNEMEKEGRLIKKNPFEGYHDYLMPSEVASIYGSMKVLFSDCLDKIRSSSQDKIWNIKTTISFRDRQDFNNLSEAFFDVESFLLENLIRITENKLITQKEVKNIIHTTYQKLKNIGYFLQIDTLSVINSESEVSEKILTIMSEKSWNTFREEYRWNQD